MCSWCPMSSRHLRRHPGAGGAGGVQRRPGGEGAARRGAAPLHACHPGAAAALTPPGSFLSPPVVLPNACVRCLNASDVLLICETCAPCGWKEQVSGLLIAPAFDAGLIAWMLAGKQVGSAAITQAEADATPAASESAQDDAAPATPSNGRAVVTVPAPADADPDTVSKAVLAVEHGGANGTTPGKPLALPAPDQTARANGRSGHAPVSPASPATVPARFDGGTGASPGAEAAQSAAALAKAAVSAGARPRSPACLCRSVVWHAAMIVACPAAHLVRLQLLCRAHPWSCRSDVHGRGALLIALLARSAGGPPGSAAEQWRALARQQALLAAAPDDEVLGELLVLQARAPGIPSATL